jgi:RNA-directed DNA polymerase
MNKAKQFEISQTTVREAYERVKANKGAAGVDGQTIEDFERNLERNLYKIWNRMSSASYFPPAIKGVEIPKKDGSIRMLGVPTVADRVAQTVMKMYLEPEVEPIFHDDSYGYRPCKSAIDAVGKARERCFKKSWVIDLDIKGFFDNLDHKLVQAMVKDHTDCKWIHLYTERWLKAPMQMKDGTTVARDKGSPQGSVVSPLLSNIFLHYAFDNWMSTEFGTCPFERYADDIVVHCSSEKQAEYVLRAINERLAGYKLELHPEKTKIVFCKNANRPGSYEVEKFDFLGYTFRPRPTMDGHLRVFTGFTPAISDKASTEIRRQIRSWRLGTRSDQSLEELARFCNEIVRGWINYYGRFCRSAMNSIFSRINRHLAKWATRKFKTFRNKPTQARRWIATLIALQPELFAHWKFGLT